MRSYKEDIKLNNTEFKTKVFTNYSFNKQNNLIRVHPHWHDMVEILYVIEGSAKQQINEKVFEIAKSDIVIIKGQDIHSTYSLSKDATEILVIQFDKSIFNSHETNLVRAYDIFSRNTDISFPIKSTENPGKQIRDYILTIAREYEHKKPAWEFAIVSCCSGIITSCIRNYMTQDDVFRLDSKHKKNLKKVFDLVDNGYGGKITLKEAAETINYSIPHFCRIFKMSTGMSFVEYLNHYRIKVSIDLLKNGKSVTEAAFACGFSSINSFIRSFKKYTGISPGKFCRV